MTAYHDELKLRRRRYLRDCMLCRWGSLRHCDFALSYPHLGIAERWDLLRQRKRLERWHPFRDRSQDEYQQENPTRAQHMLPYAMAAAAGALIAAVTWIAFPELVGL
jgi:hypothetical protein